MNIYLQRLYEAGAKREPDLIGRWETRQLICNVTTRHHLLDQPCNGVVGGHDKLTVIGSYFVPACPQGVGRTGIKGFL